MSILTKIVIAGLFVMFIVPMAGIVMLQGAASYTMAVVSKDLEKKLNDDPVENAFPKVTNAKGKRILRAMADMEKLSDFRNARIGFLINIKDLRDNKGKRYTNSQVESFAGIIASDYATKECELLTHELASSCDILKSKGKVLTDRRSKQEYLKIKMTLRFVQKAEFGLYDTDADLRFEEIDSPTFGGKSVKIQPRNQKKLAAWRLRIYEKIARNCKKVKKRFNNCAINSISVISSIKSIRNKTFYFGIAGSAKFGVLKNEA